MKAFLDQVMVHEGMDVNEDEYLFNAMVDDHKVVDDIPVKAAKEIPSFSSDSGVSNPVLVSEEPSQATSNQNQEDGMSNARTPAAASSKSRSFKSKLKSLFTFRTSSSVSRKPLLPHALDASSIEGEGASIAPKTVNEEVLKKFQEFKNFDIVEDHSDHFYSNNSERPSKSWTKKIQKEWKILKNSLPDSIYVRVYETRMDLLTAAIVGAEGTPYHNGLFFFDVFFPRDYPKIPPHVYYYSGGLNLNPNLYASGNVCLSLLGTWDGNEKEMWIPGVSTMLQVLVSIQGLILNKEPFFNEPGTLYSKQAKLQSQRYNEKVFFLSLKTMVYTMTKLHKNFEYFILGHFHRHARDILEACKAYSDGAQVGSMLKGGTQDVDKSDKSCSKEFQESLPAHIDILVKELAQIGVQGFEDFHERDK